ncbi:DEAD/DEAH box helicase family protein [Candidatus Woesearchaeota archaeon]|nr:DEAD/DEAH box helicase family protein [Candidatus Woesearchaeota archaeon]
MVKIRLKNKDSIPASLPKTELASPESFSMGLIAHSITALDNVGELLGRNSYAGKIEILEHQTRTALHVLNNFSHRALLADEVGLGKTIEAGIIIKEYIVRKLAKKVLVLTPATLKYQWQEEMRSKFELDFKVADDPSDYDDFDLVIASIDTAKTKRHAPTVQSVKWDLLIIDEAHKLKNSSTQNYKLVKGIDKDRCLMLTATPLQNNIFELWALLDLLHPGFLGSKTHFQEHFIADDQGLKIRNRDLLQDKLGKIMIRNLRKDTGIKFPDRKVHTKMLDYSQEEMEFYRDAIAYIKNRYMEVHQQQSESQDDTKDTEDMDQADLKKMAEQYKEKGLLTFALIMLTRQITSSIKTGVAALERYKEAIDDPTQKKLVEDLANRGKFISGDRKLDYLLKLLKKEKDKVIIFTTFVHTQKMIELELQLNGFSTVLFNGKMNPEEKEAAIEQFKGDKQILICTDAGSEGRNLQFAHILINFDLPWNPMRIEQRIGRVHRIGQKKDVVIHNLAIKDTVEAYILNRLYEKINLFRISIGEMDMILSQLKTKGTTENAIFDAYINDNEEFAKDLETAAKKAEDIKEFDTIVFDKKNGQ